MERDEILRGVTEIPACQLGNIAADNEIWEGQDGRAHFKVTRRYFGVRIDLELVMMSVSGLPDERKRVINEFTEVLGAPDEVSVRDGYGHVDTASWLIDEVYNV